MLDKEAKTTEENIKKVLEDTFQYYQKLDGLTAGFKKNWNFSKSSGWMQKVHDGKKALYYFIPKDRFFIINFTIRENERTAFLSLPELSELHNDLENAKKYPEGYAMRFPVKDKESFSRLMLLMGKLIEMRG